MPTAKKLPSGNWRCLVYLGKNAAGKPVRRSVTASTKKEAERQAALLEYEEEQEAARARTVSEATDAYLEDRAGVLSPSTIRGYRAIARVAFAPIANAPVTTMTSERVQRFISDYALTHAPKTTSNVYGLLTAVIGIQCPDLKLRVRLPQRDKTEINIPTRAQVDQLLAAADPELKTAIVLAAMLGLRRGEICALDWKDIWQDTLTVRHALAADETYTWHVKKPKSRSGSRVLPIPPAALTHLTQIRKENRPRPVPISPDALTTRFERLAKSLDIPVTLHSLRHYYASVMLSLGVPDKYAMARMGHSTPHMLKTVYQHLMADKNKELDEAINNYFADPPAEKQRKAP